MYPLQFVEQPQVEQEGPPLLVRLLVAVVDAVVVGAHLIQGLEDLKEIMVDQKG